MDTAIALLAKTDGRDKLLKAAAGATKILAAYTGNKKHAQLSAGCGEARSLLRMIGWIKNLDTMSKNKFNGPQEIIMFLRVLCDAVYCFHDNLAYLTKYGFLHLTAAQTLQYRGLVGLFWGFVFAVVLDIYALATMKPGTDMKTIQNRVLMLVRNTCDMLAGLAQVGYIKAFKLSPAMLGSLGLLSALIASKENWVASIPAPKKKE